MKKNTSILLLFLTFTSCVTLKPTEYKGKVIDPVTFTKVFLDYDKDSSYSLPVSLTQPKNVKFQDRDDGRSWTINYLFDTDEIDYCNLGEISDNKFAFLIRFHGGTLPTAKLLICEVTKDSLFVLGQKDILNIPKIGIQANYQYIHLKEKSFKVKDIIGYDLKPKSKQNGLKDITQTFYLKKQRDILFARSIGDSIKLSLVNGQPMLWIYSPEDFNRFDKRPNNHMENLNKGDLLTFYFNRGDFLNLTFTEKPNIHYNEKRQAILRSNQIYLTKKNLENLSKNKTIAIKTGKRILLFKGHPKYTKALDRTDYTKIPSLLKNTSKKFLYQIN